MSTIKKLVYTVWRKIEGGDIPQTSKYTYRELRGYVVSGIAKALKDSYFEQRNLEDFKYGDDSITTTYKTSVLTEDETNLKYVALQNKTISIAGNRFTQVTSASPITKWSINYIPIRREELMLRRMQPCIPNVVLFYKQDGKIFFYGDKQAEASVFVHDRYSIPASDDAELTLPRDFDNQIVEQVLRLIVPSQFPSDRQNDGVPNT